MAATKVKLKLKTKLPAPKKAGKVKKAKGASTRVNFDMETSSYSSAAEAASKHSRSIAAAGRQFLEALAELGKNGAKSQVAQAAKTIISQELPEGSRIPGGKPKAPKAPKAAATPKKVTKVAAPAPEKKVLAAPAPAVRLLPRPAAAPAPAAASAPVAAPAPRRFVFVRPA